MPRLPFLRELWPAAAFLLVVTAASLGPGLGGELLNWDDDRFVRSNELIRRVSFESLGEIFSAPHFEAYQPLHLVSYFPDYRLFGLWAPGYKLHNLVLWCVALALLLLLLRRLGLGRGAALAGALVFAAHPLHVESVCWVTARKDSLSLVFMLGSALLYLGARSWRDRRGVLALVLFGLALLTKSSTVVLPALLFLIDVLLGQRPWRASLLRLIPFAVLALAIGVVVISLWQENEIARPLPENGYLGHLALIGKTYWHYLASACWPARLSPVYPIDRVGAFEWRVAAGFGAWIALLVIAWRGRDRLVLLGVAWAAVALLPVSNVVPVYFFVQDRYALIATIGAAVALGRVFEKVELAERARLPARVALVVIVLALAAVSAVQAVSWRSSRSLWERATSAQPGAYYAFLALGHTRRDEGDLDAAIAAYERAVELQPGLPYARISLCLADARRNQQQAGRPEGEVDRIGVALRRGWGSPAELLRMATWMDGVGYGRCAELARARAEAVESSPASP